MKTSSPLHFNEDKINSFILANQNLYYPEFEYIGLFNTGISNIPGYFEHITKLSLTIPFNLIIETRKYFDTLHDFEALKEFF
jgi:hypothetical protein